MIDHEDDVVELTQALVRAASPNPPGDERAVQDVVLAYLRRIPGVRIDVIEARAHRPIVVGTLEGAQPGRRILFSGHVDTVPAGDGWTRDPFGGEVSGDRLYGRGASDMKGGVAAFLVALRRLAQRRSELAGTVVVHVVPDEEPGGVLGAKVLLDRGLIVGDAAIVAEPSELAVYTAQKGNIFASVRVAGRSAHGSMPDRGVNAITAAARLINDLESRLAPHVSAATHPLVGAATLSVGTINGGRATNIVPDECTFTLDRRLLPGQSANAAFAELERFIDGRGSVSIDNAGASFETPGDHWLVTTAMEAVGDVTGRTPRIGGLVGSSDARFYADGAGIPTIIVGPGAMSQAHVADEHVETKCLRLCVDVYERLVYLALDASEEAGRHPLGD